MAYRMKRRAVKRPRRYVRKTRAYRKKRTYRRTRIMNGRSKTAPPALKTGFYYKTNEIINKGTLELKEFWQNNTGSGDPANPSSTTIPTYNFDLADLTRANKLKDEFQWYRFKRCVLRVKPAQSNISDGIYSSYQCKNNPNGEPPNPPSGVIEPPYFVTFFDGDGANVPPKSYNNAVCRPYSKLHSFYSKYGFARPFKPMIIRNLKIGKDDATEMDYDKKYKMPWLPLNEDAQHVEIYGPQMYIPPVESSTSTSGAPQFICTVSVEVEFKGMRANTP